MQDRRAHPPSNARSLKPASQTVTLRLPDSMAEKIREQARQRDISFQAMIKVLLTEKLGEKP